MVPAGTCVPYRRFAGAGRYPLGCSKDTTARGSRVAGTWRMDDHSSPAVKNHLTPRLRWAGEPAAPVSPRGTRPHRSGRPLGTAADPMSPLPISRYGAPDTELPASAEAPGPSRSGGRRPSCFSHRGHNGVTGAPPPASGEVLISVLRRASVSGGDTDPPPGDYSSARNTRTKPRKPDASAARRSASKRRCSARRLMISQYSTVPPISPARLSRCARNR